MTLQELLDDFVSKKAAAAQASGERAAAETALAAATAVANETASQKEVARMALLEAITAA